MTLPFTKMHGLGNDFVVIDIRLAHRRPDIRLPDTETIRRLCDRRHGIGCDQLVLLAAPTHPEADVTVRFFNPDGSESAACGNASRCVSIYLADAPAPVLQTLSGLLETQRNGDLITVNMGRPRLNWPEVPVRHACDTLHLPLRSYDTAACSMGNPHVTVFNTTEPVEALGPILEKDDLFPERANIGFVTVINASHLRLRVWERGAGLTPACGSGACAAVVNAARRGLVERACQVIVDGGVLHIEWKPDDTVWMTGPATRVFDGVWP